jgi:hypothetical protein
MATLDDAELIHAVREFRAAYPILQERAQNNLLRRQLAERDRAAQPDPEEQRAQLEASLRASLDDGFAEVRKQPWAKGLTDDDIKDLRAAAEELGTAFVVAAPADDPDNGIRKGEPLFHEEKFLAFVQRQAGPITRARAASVLAAAAEKKNAAALQTTVTAPPSVGGNRTNATPTKVTKPTPAKPRSRAEEQEEWRKEMGLTV